jgi:trigger factor
MADEEQSEALKEEETTEPTAEEQPEALREKETTEPKAEEEPEAKKEEYSGPKDIVTIEDAGPCKKKVTIEIARQKIDYTTDKQYKELGKEAMIPGFRKGRAPRRLLEKRFGKETTEQIKLTLMADASKTAIEENKLQTIGEPDIDTEKRFLWSSKLECQGDLDKGTISDELRREFEDNKAPLSTQATISVEQPESSWLITDGLNKYPIRKVEQQLNIYEKIELPAEGSLKFDFEVEVRPEFDLPQLEGIPVTRTKLEVTDEQIDRDIEQMQRWSGVWTPREKGSVELEDQIIADAVLKIEGIEEEQKLDNIEIYVRQNGFVGEIPVEKLGELLVGAKSGDAKETSVDVPKTFFREEYRGKKVDIQISIKDVKWLKPAELDENLLKRYGVEDKDELREKIHDTLHGRLETQVRTEMTEQIFEYLLDKTDLDLPVNVVAEQANSVLQRQYTNLLMRGLSREQISEQMEQLQASSEQQAEQQVKTFFIMDKIADKLDIDVSEEEINGHIAQLAIQRGQRPEKMREDMERNGSLAQLTLEVRQDKCIAKLLETAVITEKKPEKAKKAKKPAKKTTKKEAKKSAEPEEKQS